MLPDIVSALLMTLLQAFAPLFTAPSFHTFCALACGFLVQPGKRTVCGMLVGSGLARLGPHDQAHSFFSRARWNADDLGLAAAVLVLSLLVPAGTPVDAAINDTLFKRRRKKVWAASSFHDGSAPGPARTGFCNNWVVLGIIGRLPFMSRPAAVPVMAKLVIKGSNSKSRLWLACRMAEQLAAALPSRRIRVAADSAYADRELKGLPPQVPWTTRLRKDAALHALPPARTGKPGCPRVKGDRLPTLAKLAATATFPGHAYPLRPDRDRRRRRGHLPVALGIRVAAGHRRHCPRQACRHRHRPRHHRPRRRGRTGHRKMRFSLVHRNRDRGLKQVFGVGQARNGTARAVERTVPFEVVCQAVTVTWYATAGHDPADLYERRASAP